MLFVVDQPYQAKTTNQSCDLCIELKCVTSISVQTSRESIERLLIHTHQKSRSGESLRRKSHDFSNDLFQEDSESGSSTVPKVIPVVYVETDLNSILISILIVHCEITLG